MAEQAERFTTPVGRFVQGDPFVAQTKDQQGNLRVVKSGPNAGQPSPQYFVALAFPKVLANGQQNDEFNAFYAMLDRVARAAWPALFPNPGGPCVNPLFTMKVKDGDGIDRNGKKNSDKEGFAGHWIVSFASAYAPKVVQPVGGSWQTITDPAALKRGYYVRVAGSCAGNNSTATPGLYVNLDMIELVAFGPEIVSGPDAATAFAAPVTLPPGASALPVGVPAGLPVGGPPALPGALPGLPGGYGAPTAGVPALPGAAAPVNTAYMQPPPPPATAAAPPPLVPPTMTAAAGGVTREAYHAAGWTDAQLIAQGFMIA